MTAIHEFQSSLAKLTGTTGQALALIQHQEAT